MPIVADVDADGHADLVVPSDSHWPDTYCNDQNPEPHTGAMHTGHTTGLFVLRDPMNRWVSSRTLWNQHTYHITNVSDDGTIPHLEPPNHKTYNNFRQNAPGKLSSGAPAPDLTASASSMQDGGTCQISERLYAQICNRGAGAAPIVPGTFYRMDPRLGMLSPICTAQTFAYDLNGNLMSDGTNSYTFDALNRLVSVTGAVTVGYVHDALDRRTSKFAGGVTTRFLHAGSDEIAEYTDTGTLLRRYVPGAGVDERAAMIDSGSATPPLTALRLPHTDRLGSVMAVTNSVGAVTERFAYNAFGVSNSSAAGYPFRFTGQRLDPETGLMFYKARVYSTTLGRFLQTDPVVSRPLSSQGWNAYSYALNNPLKFVDPSGFEDVITVPTTHIVVPRPSMENSLMMRSRAEAPKREHESGSFASGTSAAARLSTDPGSMSRPSTPSRTSSGTPPTRLEITARRLAIASMSTTGTPSMKLLTTMTSAAS